MGFATTASYLFFVEILIVSIFFVEILIVYYFQIGRAAKAIVVAVEPRA